MWIEYATAAAVILLLLLGLRSSLRHVNAEEAVVVERAGKFHRCLDGGWHVLIPLRDFRRRMYWRSVETGLDGTERVVDRFRWRIDRRPTQFELADLQVATEDQVPFRLRVTWSAAIASPQIAAYADSHLPRAVSEATAGLVQQELAKQSAEALLKDLGGAAARVREALAEKLGGYGLRVVELQFASAAPADAIRSAFEEKIAAAKRKEAAVLDAETAAQVALEEGKTRQRLEIMAAETTKRTMKLTAEAEAEAIGKIGSALENADVARHALALRYLEVLRQLAAGTNAKVIFIPFDASSPAAALDLMRRSVDAEAGP